MKYTREYFLDKTIYDFCDDLEFIYDLTVTHSKEEYIHYVEDIDDRIIHIYLYSINFDKTELEQALLEFFANEIKAFEDSCEREEERIRALDSAPPAMPNPDPRYTQTLHEPTPNGGAFSIAYFYDKNGMPCSREEMAYMNIVEYAEDGTRINESYGACNSH